MTAPQDEWTDWIEHDGKGCPWVGKMVHVKYRWVGINPDGTESDKRIYIARPTKSWTGGDDRVNEIIRYRIRRPKGMAILNTILADLPAPPIKQPAPGVIA